MGGVWIADSANAKMIRYRPDGGADVELPLPKSSSVNGPHIDLTPGGSVVVSDPEGGRLIVLDTSGKIRGVVQAEGVKRPVGLSIAPDGRLVVSDIANHQVIILAPLPEQA
jgi:DNA-binding beta-propeller fold protein YncE